MLVPQTITFHQETTDTSIENFLNITQASYEVVLLIIMKQLINFLKNHPESILFQNHTPGQIISLIIQKCINPTTINTIDREDNVEFSEFKKDRIKYFPLTYSSNTFKKRILVTWFLGPSIIEHLHNSFLRGNDDRQSNT